MKQFLFPLFLCITVLSSCKKFDLEKESFPEVITGNAEVDDNLLTAILPGEIKGLSEEGRVDNHGHLWTDDANEPLELPHQNRTSFAISGNGTFMSPLDNLVYGKRYYYRSYIQIGNELFYGERKDFGVGDFGIEMKIDSIRVIERTDSLINKVKVFLTYSNLPIGLNIQGGGIVMTNEPNPSAFDHFSVSFGSITLTESILSIDLTATINTNEDQSFWPYMIINGQELHRDSFLFHISDIWFRKAPFPGGPRSDAIGFSIGNKGYVGTGQSGLYIVDSLKSDFWEYDPSTDTWAELSPFPGGNRTSAIGFSIGNKGYVGTGDDGNSYKSDFWEYDPSTGTWDSLAPFPGGDVNSAIGFSIGSKGYVGMGTTTSFWEYDPSTDTWDSLTHPGGFFGDGPVSFSIRNKGYIWESGYGNLWEFDPAQSSIGQWTEKGILPGDFRRFPIGFSIGNKGYMGTGDNGFGAALKDFWEYDPDDGPMGKWTEKDPYPGGRRQAAISFSIGNKGYVGTGYDGRFFKSDFWVFHQ